MVRRSFHSNRNHFKDDDEDNDSDDKLKKIFIGFCVFIVAFLILAFIQYQWETSGEQITFQEFTLDYLLPGKVDGIRISNDEIVYFSYEGKPYDKFMMIRDFENFDVQLGNVLRQNGMNVTDITFEYTRFPRLKNYTFGLTTIAHIGFLGFIVYNFTRRTGGAGSNPFSMGQKIKKFDKKSQVKTKFKDVAGCDEAKVEITEFVDFLKNPDKYTSLGAKIPKGAILVGPPGTGKTLMAKATAGEANVPFFYTSGSDFVEVYVGMGPSRVRKLFKEARAEKKPCIIFIDEIDAIGRKRGGGYSGGNDERENTLNALLVEMDGFETSVKNPVIVLAGTNRVDILDKALLRPGRFDRQIQMDLPDINAREEILLVHLAKLTLSKEPEYFAKKIAALTPGFSGADLANCCNEAALIAAKNDKEFVEAKDFEDSIDRVIAGLEKKDKVMSKKEKRIVAYHEAGHAITGWFLKNSNPVMKVSIIPRGSAALGFAQNLPKDRHIHTEEYLWDQVCVLLGGRAAEEIHFGKVTTGAMDDLEKVTNMAYSMITTYGMNTKIGYLSFSDNNSQGYFGKPYSDQTAELVDTEVFLFVQKAYEQVKRLLKEKEPELGKLAELLLEKEVLNHVEIEEVLGPKSDLTDEQKLYLKPNFLVGDSEEVVNKESAAKNSEKPTESEKQPEKQAEKPAEKKETADEKTEDEQDQKNKSDK